MCLLMLPPTPHVDFHTATNPRTNLARCFRCCVNFTPIEIVMAVEACPFVDAVKILSRLSKARGGDPS